MESFYTFRDDPHIILVTSYIQQVRQHKFRLFLHVKFCCTSCEFGNLMYFQICWRPKYLKTKNLIETKKADIIEITHKKQKRYTRETPSYTANVNNNGSDKFRLTVPNFWLIKWYSFNCTRMESRL